MPPCTAITTGFERLQADRVDVIRILGRELARGLRGREGPAVDPEGEVATDAI